MNIITRKDPSIMGLQAMQNNFLIQHKNTESKLSYINIMFPFMCSLLVPSILICLSLQQENTVAIVVVQKQGTSLGMCQV